MRSVLIKKKFMNVADLVDPHDPAGRTWREINDATAHQTPVGSLVELDGGGRLVCGRP